jgi:Tol biopolymer transport system component
VSRTLIGLWASSIIALQACAAPPASIGGPSSTAVITAEPQGAPSPSATRAAQSDAPTVASGEAWVSFQWADSSGADGIFLVRPDGTGRHQLVADLPGAQRHPDWSPSGEQLAFVQQPPGKPDELWVVDADGTDARKLVSCDLPCNEFNYPDWGQDGTAIFYGLDADAKPAAPPTTFEVARFDIASGQVTTVLRRKDGQTAEQPRISPDGTHVVFDRGEIVATTGMSIYVADLNGGPERRLTDPKLFGAHPDWSVDGRIVFNSYDLGFFQDTTEPANLYTVEMDGTTLRALTAYGDHDTRATQPRFTPDGAGIVYTQVDGDGYGVRRLAFMNADGTGQRWLTPEPIEGTHPQLRPLP